MASGLAVIHVSAFVIGYDGVAFVLTALSTSAKLLYVEPG